jgi:hypothetical protein
MFCMCTPGLSMPSPTLFRFVLPSIRADSPVPGEIEIDEWKCLAELIDTTFDDFNESIVFII